MTRHYRTYTEEEFVNAVKKSSSCAQVLKKLNLRPTGGNYETVKKKVAHLSLDCSHWKGQSWNVGKRLKDWKSYKKNKQLKPHLIKLRGHKCEQCSLAKWKEKDIVLEVHHLDNNRVNNDFSNLQLLCPNCHSQTNGWRGRKST